MIYLDTSYLARLYLCDAGFEYVRALAASDRVACSCHGEVELFAVFHHLAGAKAHGFPDVYSNDRHLIEASTYFGINGVNVIPTPKT